MQIKFGGDLVKRNFKQYALLMKALSDETRLKIFDMLSGGELCACKILEEFNITQPTLSYHMKLLCDSGLVKGRRDGVWMRYSIDRNVLGLMIELFGSIEARLPDDAQEFAEEGV